MKYLIVVILSVSAHAALGQTPADSLFIVTYTTGSGWDSAKPPQDQLFFKEHSSNLSQWRKDGIIKLGARYADKGMIVMAAATFSKAKELIFSDEAVIHKTFQADIQKLWVFYDGCLERPVKK